MKLISWNVNGIRAAARQGALDWLRKENSDFFCLQEVKAFPEQLEFDLRQPPGYHCFWNSAEKPGYSGVATFSKKEPLSVRKGLGDPSIDCEGRVIELEFKDFILINAYFPNSQRDHARLDYKLRFCELMHRRCKELREKGKHVVLCGDFNIAHRAIDLRNPKANENNAGYLPSERAWMDQFTQDGYVDAFRKFNGQPGHYTWWSYRPGVRDKNIGWRLDYFVVNPESVDRLQNMQHRTEIKGSDHCPVMLELWD